MNLETSNLFLVMESDEKLANSAQSLSETLAEIQGFVAVGIGIGPSLIVYFTKIRNSHRPRIPAYWDSFPVKIQETGRFAPLKN